MSDPTRRDARATATDASAVRRRRARDDASLGVHPWMVWLVAVLMLAGAVVLLAGWSWVGVALGAAGVACVVGLIVRARRSQ